MVMGGCSDALPTPEWKIGFGKMAQGYYEHLNGFRQWGLPLDNPYVWPLGHAGTERVQHFYRGDSAGIPVDFTKGYPRGGKL